MDPSAQTVALRRGGRCGSDVDPEHVATRRMRLLRQLQLDQRNTDVASSTERICFDIVYRILYRNAGDNLSLDRLKSQHQTLNACFNQSNSSHTRVPKSGHYNFDAVKGNARITFLPSDYRNLTEDKVERIQTDREFDDLSQALAWLKAKGHVEIVAGKMNVIIAPLSNILGQASLESNVCIVATGSVGGEALAGSLSRYGLGVTAVHEIGHCLGLPHPFGAGNSCAQVFSDIPGQINPNYDFQLVQSGDVWDGALCNRDRDCKHYRNGDTSVLISGVSLPYSCFTCNETAPACDACDSQLYEQGCNFMGYSSDANLVMFSKQQCTYMRQIALAGDTGLSVYACDSGEIQSSPSGQSGLSTWVIVGIVVGSLAVLVVVVWLVLVYTK